MSENQQLRIAVASDLHAYEGDLDPSPSHLKITNPEYDQGKHPITGLLTLIREQDLHADLLLSPGDLGDKVQTAGIQYAWKAIHQLGAALRARLITASSGNHDLDSRHLNSVDPKEVLQSLEPPYPHPDESHNNKYRARHFVLIDDTDFRLVILNSSAYHGGEPKEIEHGRVTDHTLDTMKKELSQGGERPVNILLCHHHPHLHTELNLGEHDTMMGGQRLLDLLGSGDFGNWMVIHGHKHHPKLTYASGSACSPVILSAGSLCANLVLELQTRARNQFYIVTIPLNKIRAMGLVGVVSAWDWAYGAGWASSAGRSSGLPATSGFGIRDGPERLAEKVALFVNGEMKSWGEVMDGVPEIKYILPQDLTLLERQLDKHDLCVTWSGDIPVEIGVSAV